MKRAVTSDQMKKLDQYTIQKRGMPSLLLMERAALSVVDVLKKEFDLRHVLVICGSGNNGGDGVAIARILHGMGIPTDIYDVGNRDHRTRETVFQYETAEKYDVPMVNNLQYSEYTTIVDAIFGVGLSRTVSGDYAKVIQAVNHSQIPVCAVDVPSGIDASTGQILGCAMRAKVTVTFAFTKVGLLLYPGAEMAGTCILKDVGIYDAEEKLFEPDIYMLTDRERELFPKRISSGNKGSFGKALLIAGAQDCYGAVYLSALACMRSGAGMIKIVTSVENKCMLQEKLPEAMLLTYEAGDDVEKLIQEGLAWTDAVGIGPGIGQTPEAVHMVEYLLKTADKPLVLDADALNILCGHMEWLCDTAADCILTPHMGEMARLTQKGIGELKENPVAEVLYYAHKWHTQVVMKDARTCVAAPDGCVYINCCGNDGMATAGSGDVLTGIILAMLCQSVPLSLAGAVGVLLHGKSGDAAKKRTGTHGMLARDIIQAIPEVYEENRYGKIQ